MGKIMLFKTAKLQLVQTTGGGVKLAATSPQQPAATKVQQTTGLPLGQGIASHTLQVMNNFMLICTCFYGQDFTLFRF